MVNSGEPTSRSRRMHQGKTGVSVFSIYDSRFTIHHVMFCPSCGAEYTIGLNYCNRCGANLNTALNQIEMAPVNVTKPVMAIGLIILLTANARIAVPPT